MPLNWGNRTEKMRKEYDEYCPKSKSNNIIFCPKKIIKALDKGKEKKVQWFNDYFKSIVGKRKTKKTKNKAKKTKKKMRKKRKEKRMKKKKTMRKKERMKKEEKHDKEGKHEKVEKHEKEENMKKKKNMRKNKILEYILDYFIWS